MAVTLNAQSEVKQKKQQKNKKTVNEQFIYEFIFFVLILPFICPLFCGTPTTLGRIVCYADYVMTNVEFSVTDYFVARF